MYKRQVLERCNNQYGKMWECPDFFPLDGKQVLMLGPMEMLPKGEFHNGHNVIAFIGSYDQAKMCIRDSRCGS